MCCSTRSKSADVGILSKAFLPPLHEANAPRRAGSRRGGKVAGHGKEAVNAAARAMHTIAGAMRSEGP